MSLQPSASYMCRWGHCSCVRPFLYTSLTCSALSLKPWVPDTDTASCKTVEHSMETLFGSQQFAVPCRLFLCRVCWNACQVQPPTHYASMSCRRQWLKGLPWMPPSWCAMRT